MKICSDFVTNSSSSSFIFAIKKDIKKEHIYDFINKDEFTRWLNDCGEWLCYDKTLDVDDIYEKMCDAFFKLHTVIELDDYNICGADGSSEASDIFSNMLYGLNFNDNDFIIYNSVW